MYVVFPDLPSSDQWITSIYSKNASAIAIGTFRCSDLDQLNVPRVRTAVGNMAFSVAAPKLWNELPLEIRSAKIQISFWMKTYFFGLAFRI